MTLPNLKKGIIKDPSPPAVDTQVSPISIPNGTTLITTKLHNEIVDNQDQIIDYISGDDGTKMPQSVIDNLSTDLSNKENLTNKSTDLTTPDNTKYPTTLAVQNGLDSIDGLLPTFMIKKLVDESTNSGSLHNDLDFFFTPQPNTVYIIKMYNWIITTNVISGMDTKLILPTGATGRNTDNVLSSISTNTDNATTLHSEGIFNTELNFSLKFYRVEIGSTVDSDVIFAWSQSFNFPAATSTIKKGSIMFVYKI